MVWDGINLAWDCMEIDQIAQISGFHLDNLLSSFFDHIFVTHEFTFPTYLTHIFRSSVDSGVK